MQGEYEMFNFNLFIRRSFVFQWRLICSSRLMLVNKVNIGQRSHKITTLSLEFPFNT